MQKLLLLARQSIVALVISVVVFAGGSPAVAFAEDAAPVADGTAAVSQQSAPAPGAEAGQPGTPGAAGTDAGSAVPATPNIPAPTATAAPTDTSTTNSAAAPEAAAAAITPAPETPTIPDANPVAANGPVSGTIADPGAGQPGSLLITPVAIGPTLDLNQTTDTAQHTVINSAATTGNAGTLRNTTAGNTTTGDANATANILNLLQSSSALAGSGAVFFTADIQGSVVGDFLIDPAALAQPATTSADDLNKLTINNSTAASIANDVALNAKSGDASAVENTTVGDVGSGEANAVANVVNMINSTVAAGTSFFGVINIFGDLVGNILLPAGSLDSILANNLPLLGGGASDTSVDSTTNEQIHNNIGLDAASGEVLADANTRTGNVGSGDSLTKLTLLNLTGRNVIAANSLLVFVNVLGSWVGLIMDAPQGATSAALTGGASGADYSDDSQAYLPADSTINTTDNLGITNNITATARSGSAEALRNTTVGNVASGAATASANIANMIGSNFALSNWFGVLFINVFGSWHGNFGVAKPPVVTPDSTGNTAGAGQSGGFVQYTPGSGGSGRSATQASYTGYSDTTGNSSSPAGAAVELVNTARKVLAASTKKATSQPAATSYVAADSFDWSKLVLAAGLIGFAYYGVDRVRTNLRAGQLVRGGFRRT